MKVLSNDSATGGDLVAKKRLKILHVCEHAQGGTATSVSTLVNEQLLDPDVHETKILVAKSESVFLQVPQSALLTFRWKGRNPVGLYQLLRQYQRATSENKPDIVHLQGTFAGLIGRSDRCLRPWTRYQIACIYCSRGWAFLMDIDPWKKRVYAFCERVLANCCERIICISNDEREEAIAAGISAEKCVRVHNAIAADSPIADLIEVPAKISEAKRAGRKVFLFVGRYDQQKGLDIILPLFTDKNAPGLLLAAGGGVHNQKTPDFGGDSIDLGWLKQGQLTTAFEWCDALVMPSRWEGFGLVAAEAMRAGRAVICSRQGGLPEIVIDSETGIVIDSLVPEVWREKLNAISSKTLRKMGQRGQQRFQDYFTAPRLHRETMQVYRDALHLVSSPKASLSS